MNAHAKLQKYFQIHVHSFINFFSDCCQNKTDVMLAKYMMSSTYSHGVFMAWWLLFDEEFGKIVRFPPFSVMSDKAKFNEKLLRFLNSKVFPNVVKCEVRY